MKHTSNTGMELDIRLAGENDLSGVIDCIRSVNGELFYKRDMYSQEFLRHAVEQGEMKIFVASGSDKRVYATLSLVKNDFDRLPCTFSAFMSRPDARGMGLASKLQAFALETLAGFELPSFHAFPLTTHTFSQNIAEKQGFIPTGFLFGVSDESKVTPDPSVRSQKRTLAAYTIAEAKKHGGTLYLPNWLEAFARNIYDALGAGCNIDTQPHRLMHATELKSFHDPLHCVTHVQVMRCGEDLAERLACLEDNDSPIHTVTMYLNASDPTANRGLSLLLERRYMFTGFYPLAEDGEYITLFRQGTALIFFDEISTTPLSKAILEFLLRRMKY